jgi:hypothetical protein
MKGKFRKLPDKTNFRNELVMIEEMERMLVNETNMRSALINLRSKLQKVEPMLKGRRVIYHKVRYLELQERCETLLEDVNREFGFTEQHITEVNKLEKSVNFWLARLENEDA